MRETEPRFTGNRRRLFLLVHGYNNSEAVARESFGRFMDNLRTMGPAGRGIAEDAGFVYWPGDTNLGLLVSAASYPLQVGRAIRSGENLGEYLADLMGPAGTPTEIYLIGHSLGCRLILEVLETLWQRQFSAALGGRRRPTVLIAGVSLMAAAVPESLVGERWPGLAGIGRPQRACVLHSAYDWVLHWTFPEGETLAGEGVLPRAVGRFGEPHALWTWRRDLAPNGHGHYWADARSTTEAVRLVNGPVPAGPEDKRLATRSLPEGAPRASRSLAERRLAVRALPDL